MRLSTMERFTLGLNSNNIGKIKVMEHGVTMI